MTLRQIAGLGLCVVTLLVGTRFGSAQAPEGRGGQPGAQAGGRGRGGPVERDLLYVAVPGRTNDIGYGGIGILVFDVNRNYRFVKRIPTWDYPASQLPENVKGIAASAATGLLYVSTIKRIAAWDMKTDQKVWEQTYDGSCCDRMALSPDGKTLYIPSFEGPFWYVADALTGQLIKKLVTAPTTEGAHNTIYSPDGSRVFMAGLRSRTMSIADAKTHTVVQTVGPFSNNARVFTINGAATTIYTTVNGLLGFEVGDVKSGKMIHRVEVKGFGWEGRVRGHGVPSHGVALSPDQTELWVADGANPYLHVFDATVMPPKQVLDIPIRSEAFWITWGLNGKVLPSSGDIIDAKTKRVIGGLKDETGRLVESEKLVEVLFTDGKPVRTVDQFGIGQTRSATN